MAEHQKSALAGRRETASTCARCGGTFICGMQAGQEPCWCAALPPALPLPTDGKGCYCPACLKAMIEQAASGLAT